MALVKGTENATWGFRNPADGWHTVKFAEGVSLKVNETSGKESLYIPMVVDEGSEDDGIKIGTFVNTRDENRQFYKNAEKNVADIVTNAGLYDAFATKFSDAESWLDGRIIEALKLKLIDVFVMVETKTGTDNKGNQRCNVVGWAPKGTAKEKKATPDTGKKKETKKLDTGSDW
jgi:hypothetical protein